MTLRYVWSTVSLRNTGRWRGLIPLQGTTLLDPTAQLEDIFWGIYHWLDGHSSETILVSVKVDNGANTAELQQKVYNLITGDNVKDYWVQSTIVCNLLKYTILTRANDRIAADSRSRPAQGHFRQPNRVQCPNGRQCCWNKRCYWICGQ